MLILKNQFLRKLAPFAIVCHMFASKRVKANVTGPMKTTLNAAIINFQQRSKYACDVYRVDFQLT